MPEAKPDSRYQSKGKTRHSMLIVGTASLLRSIQQKKLQWFCCCFAD